MSSQKRRIETDVMKLLMSDYDVSLVNNSMQEFFVKFKGPQDTPFQGGTWKIHVELPDNYPYKSPSIGFVNKIFHPNIDEGSGSVCLDVINQTWSPMFDVFNIFEVFLPQLLSYPNASDPLNCQAATLLQKDRESYEQKIKEYIAKYAQNPDFKSTNRDDDDSDEELSDVSSLSDDDDDDDGDDGNNLEEGDGSEALEYAEDGTDDDGSDEVEEDVVLYYMSDDDM